MTGDEWFTATDARRLLGISLGKVSGRKLRLFMVAYCRLNWERVSLPVVREAVELAELFADGRTSKKRLEALFDEGRSHTGRHSGYYSGPIPLRWATASTDFV